MKNTSRALEAVLAVSAVLSDEETGTGSVCDEGGEVVVVVANRLQTEDLARQKYRAVKQAADWPRS